MKDKNLQIVQLQKKMKVIACADKHKYNDRLMVDGPFS